MASSFRGSRYGIVLLLILADVALISGTSVRGWTYLAAVVLQGATLLACLHAARVPVAQQRVAAGLLLVAIVSVALTRVHAGDDPGTFARAVNGCLVAVAPVVIARDLWTHPRVTGHTVAGALCVYLLVGMLFSALLGLTATPSTSRSSATRGRHGGRPPLLLLRHAHDHGLRRPRAGGRGRPRARRPRGAHRAALPRHRRGGAGQPRRAAAAQRRRAPA